MGHQFSADALSETWDVLQDDKLVASIAAELLPILSASSAAVIQGDLFTGAAKHAEALKSLASLWETLRRALSQHLNEYIGEKRQIQAACKATHQNAATAKVYLPTVQYILPLPFVDVLMLNLSQDKGLILISDS